MGKALLGKYRRFNLLKNFKLMKKVAFITGGTRGIGLGISKELVKIGFDLAVNGLRKEDVVQDVLRDLKKQGSDVIYCQGNVADATDRKRIIKKLRDHYNRLNILV